MPLMTTDLYLPMFVAGRDFAEKVVDSLDGRTANRSIVVDATSVRTGTSSFAAHLVHRLLVDGRAKELIVVGPPAEFAEYLTEAAAEDAVAGRLTISEQFPLVP